MAPSPYVLSQYLPHQYVCVCARFDEIPAKGLQDIKETVLQTDGR